MLRIVEIKFLGFFQLGLRSRVRKIVDCEEILFDPIGLLDQNCLMIFPPKSSLGVDHKLIFVFFGKKNLRLIHFPAEIDLIGV